MLSGLAIRALQPLLALGMEVAQPRLEPLFEPAHHHARLEAYDALKLAGLNGRTDVDLLVVIDYDRPSYERRMSIYERGTCPIRRCLVSHGRGSSSECKLFACDFSNIPGSNATSLGLFSIGRDRPSAKFGRSIELEGLQPGLNHLAKPRTIVIHPAWYVSYGVIRQNCDEESRPRLGQSKGCPALTAADFKFLLQRIREVKRVGGRVFLYAYSQRGGSGRALGKSDGQH